MDWVHFVGKSYYPTIREFETEARKFRVSRKIASSMLQSMNFGDRIVLFQWQRPSSEVFGYFTVDSVLGDFPKEVLEELAREVEVSSSEHQDTLVARKCGQYTIVQTTDLKVSISAIARKIKQHGGKNIMLGGAYTPLKKLGVRAHGAEQPTTRIKTRIPFRPGYRQLDLKALIDDYQGIRTKQKVVKKQYYVKPLERKVTPGSKLILIRDYIKSIVTRRSDVHFQCAAPAVVRPAQQFTIDVNLHVTESQQAKPEQKVTEVGIIALKTGARLNLRLVPVDPGKFEIRRDEIEIEWRLPSRSAQFLVCGQQDLEDGDYFFELVLASRGAQIILPKYLNIRVDSTAPIDGAERCEVTAKIPCTAFASYARQDLKVVLYMLAGIAALGIKVFQDCLDLTPGKEWRQQVKREIKKSEAFLLFWSSSAKQSKYVEEEWRFALKHRDRVRIVPNLLEPTSVCAPPPELEELQFGSRETTLRDALLGAGQFPQQPA